MFGKQNFKINKIIILSRLSVWRMSSFFGAKLHCNTWITQRFALYVVCIEMHKLHY